MRSRAKGRSVGPRPGKRRYKGRPFSYHGFLEKAARPTNMAHRKKIQKIQKILLPYSEL
jgi:hypothetical protein